MGNGPAHEGVTIRQNIEGRGLTAAGDAGGGDFLGTKAGDLLKRGGDAELLGGAGHVDSHAVAHLPPLQLVLQERVDELHRLIQRHPATAQPHSFRAKISAHIMHNTGVQERVSDRLLRPVGGSHNILPFDSAALLQSGTCCAFLCLQEDCRLDCMPHTPSPRHNWRLVEEKPHLRAGSDRLVLSWPRQGEVSQTMGMTPPCEAFTSDSCSFDTWLSAASVNPFVLKIMPQHALLTPCSVHHINNFSVC